jgi:ABC-2 type transport system permease protein
MSDVTPVVPFSRRRQLSALGALFVLTLRQHAHGRRLLVLVLLFALPVGLAILFRSLSSAVPLSSLEFALAFNLLPHALAPLTALLYASGMVHDEWEEQTLTYLFLRPLPRWGIYLTKLLATLLTTTLLTALGTAALYVALYAGTPELWETVLPVRLPRVVAVMALAQVGYCALFGCLSLFIRRSLLVGVGYIFLVEGVLANLDFVVRRLTVVYYFRLLALRWLELPPRLQGEWQENWQLDLAVSPGARECVLTVLAAAGVLVALSALRFATREFRMKTPEGS